MMSLTPTVSFASELIGPARAMIYMHALEMVTQPTLTPSDLISNMSLYNNLGDSK